MKSKYLVLLSVLFLFVACNKDDEKFSDKIIGQVLFDMKATYQGELSATIVDKSSHLIDIDNFSVKSADSLTLVLPLEPIAKTLSNKETSEMLLKIGEARVVAGYEFTQIDNKDRSAVYGLKPQNIKLKTGIASNEKEITLILSQNYGGNFTNIAIGNDLTFNVCVQEVLFEGNKLDEFEPIVFNFKGRAK